MTDLLPGLPTHSGAPSSGMAHDCFAELGRVTVDAARVDCPCGHRNHVLGDMASYLRQRGEGVSMHCAKCRAVLNLKVRRVLTRG